MRQFYGRLEKCALSAGKTHVHKIPRFGGGGYFGSGGGSADFIFMGARIFLNMPQDSNCDVQHDFCGGGACIVRFQYLAMLHCHNVAARQSQQTPTANLCRETVH